MSEKNSQILVGASLFFRFLLLCVRHLYYILWRYVLLCILVSSLGTIHKLSKK